MLVSTALAQGAPAGAPSAFDPMAFLPLVLIFIVFYFLLIRPQQKKMKEHKAMIDALRRGDRIVTAGGLIGTITRVVNEEEIVIEIAEGVRVRVVRATVSHVLAKPEPAAAKGGRDRGRDRDRDRDRERERDRDRDNDDDSDDDRPASKAAKG